MKLSITNERVRACLEHMAEPDYAAFSAALIPDCPPMLGVCLPALRALAKELAPDGEQYLAQPCGDCFEEIMLRGMVIGCLKCDTARRLDYIRDFIPYIKNWSVCDSFCASLKEAKRKPEEYWAFIQSYLCSEAEFEVRFAVVMLLDYFAAGEWLPRTLRRLAQVKHEGYYVKMAVGWAISVCYIHEPECTWDWLERVTLDEQTERIAIQKCLDSCRVQGKDRTRMRERRARLRIK